MEEELPDQSYDDEYDREQEEYYDEEAEEEEEQEELVESYDEDGVNIRTSPDAHSKSATTAANRRGDRRGGADAYTDHNRRK